MGPQTGGTPTTNKELESLFQRNNPFLPPQWKFLNLKEILTEPLPPEPPWKVHGLVADGCGTQVSSHPHGMKSYTWLQAAIESSVHHKVWGHFPATTVKRALFLETEDSEWLLRRRVHYLSNGLGIKANDLPDAGCFILGCTGPFDLIQMERTLKNTIERYHPDFTVLSTLQGLLGHRDWKEQSDMAPINSLLVNIATHYSPLVSITHSPWDKKQKRAAGTVTQAANFPMICHYQKFTSQGETFASVNVDSKLGASDTETRFKLKLHKSGEESVRFGYEMASSKKDIADYIRSNPNCKASDISAQFDISERYARTLRKESLS